MDAHRPTRALAAFAAGLDPRGFPAEVREKLGWLLLDYLRVASIGARLPWSEWARGYIAVVALPGAARVLFSSDALNPEHATFMNVTFGSSFDGDDTHVGAMLHPGVASWAAALAVAEHAGVSGPEVLAAVVAGYETTIRIGLAVQPSHFERGFQSTGTCDGFGTAAAAGRLLFRGAGAARGIVEAIGLAGGYPSGIAQFYYSGSRPPMRRRAGWRPRCWPSTASPVRPTFSRAPAASPAPMRTAGIPPSSRTASARASI
jgi:2-methylcitrate dehydratase PrpD